MRIAVTPASSSAHPVTAIEPLTPSVPLTGISRMPIGGCDRPEAIVSNATETCADAFRAPMNENTTEPVAPASGELVPVSMAILTVAGPDPELGCRCNHGSVGTAVHVTDPVPLCTR